MLEIPPVEGIHDTAHFRCPGIALRAGRRRVAARADVHPGALCERGQIGFHPENTRDRPSDRPVPTTPPESGREMLGMVMSLLCPNRGQEFQEVRKAEIEEGFRFFVVAGSARKVEIGKKNLVTPLPVKLWFVDAAGFFSKFVGEKAAYSVVRISYQLES